MCAGGQNTRTDKSLFSDQPLTSVKMNGQQGVLQLFANAEGTNSSPADKESSV